MADVITNGPIAEQFYVDVQSIALAAINSSNNVTQTGPGYNLHVYKVFVKVWATIGGTLTAINPNDSGTGLCDPFTLQIEDLTAHQKMLGTNGIDVWALNEIAQDQNFKGFDIKALSNLKYTIAHAATAGLANFTAPFQVDICLAGTRTD